MRKSKKGYRITPPQHHIYIHHNNTILKPSASESQSSNTIENNAKVDITYTVNDLVIRTYLVRPQYDIVSASRFLLDNELR